MILWRLTRYPTLDGAGGLVASARWHTKGRRVIYAATSPAGALIEVLAGLELEPDVIPDGYRILKLGVGDEVAVDVVADLPAGWRTNTSATRAAGNLWLDGGVAPLLQVPSALVPDTANVLVAPARVAPAQIEILDDSPFEFDARLLPGR